MAIYCNPKINLLENEYIEEFENSFKIIMEECNINDVILENSFMDLADKVINFIKNLYTKFQMWITRTISKISQIDKRLLNYTNKYENDITRGYELIKNGKVSSNEKFCEYENFEIDSIEKNFDYSNFDILYDRIDKFFSVDKIKNGEIKIVNIKNMVGFINIYKYAFIRSILNSDKNYFGKLENQLNNILNNRFNGKITKDDYAEIDNDTEYAYNYIANNDHGSFKDVYFGRISYIKDFKLDMDVYINDTKYNSSKIYNKINKSIKDNYNRSMKYIKNIKLMFNNEDYNIQFKFDDNSSSEKESTIRQVISMLTNMFQSIYKAQLFMAKQTIYIANKYKFDMYKMFKYLVTVSQNYNNSNKNESTIFDNVQLI